MKTAMKLLTVLIVFIILIAQTVHAEEQKVWYEYREHPTFEPYVHYTVWYEYQEHPTFDDYIHEEN